MSDDPHPPHEHDHEHDHDHDHDHAFEQPPPPPARTGPQRSPEDDALVEAARDILYDQPLTPDELAERLAADGHDADRSHLDELLNTDPHVRLLADGRLADIDATLDAMNLTHRLTQAECRAGTIAIDPDFSPLSLVIVGDERSAIGGGRLTIEHTDDGPRMKGPAAWLKHARAGDPIAIIVSGPLFSIMIGGELIERSSSEVAAFLRETFDQLPGPVDLPDLVLEAMVREPELLIEPMLPLGELIERAGLQLDGGRVLPAG